LKVEGCVQREADTEDTVCTVCEAKYLEDGGCVEGSTVAWDTGCDDCQAEPVYICGVTQESGCTACYDNAETAADVTDNCWLSVASGCSDGTFTTATCDLCDWTTREISTACFDALGPEIDFVCDEPQAISVTLSGLGVTADNFAGLKEDLEASVEATLSLEDGDVVCSLPTTTRRRLAEGDVIATATVPSDDATNVIADLESPTFTADLNTNIAASSNSVLNQMTATGVSAPTTVAVTTVPPTPADTTETPADTTAADTTDTTQASNTDVDAGVSTISMLVAGLMAVLAM